MQARQIEQELMPKDPEARRLWFERHMRKWQKRASKISASLARKMLRELNAVRRQIIGLLAEAGEYKTWFLTQLQAEIDEIIASLREALLRHGGVAFEDALAQAQEKLRELGLLTAAQTIHIPDRVLAVVTQMRDTAIVDTTADARRRIMQVVRMTALGQMTLSDAIQRIGRNLTTPSIFKSIADRAETIARTEVARVFAVSTEAAAEAAERQTGKKVKMQWICGPRVCPLCAPYCGRVWDRDDPSRPRQPLHPNCMCDWLTWLEEA